MLSESSQGFESPILRTLRSHKTYRPTDTPLVTAFWPVLLRGGDYERHLGQDVSVGYLSHDADEIQLYFQETRDFLVNTAEAADAFCPADGAASVASRTAPLVQSAPRQLGIWSMIRPRQRAVRCCYSLSRSRTQKPW